MQIAFPNLIIGTSTLGNLYKALLQKDKTALVEAYISNTQKPFFFDTAGKYGAGLALESLGLALKELSVSPEDVVISNKLGWYRVPLKTPEPTFEKDVWKELKFDAEQKMGYEEILSCYEQGNVLLDGYSARLLSVHDPDEYLLAAVDKGDEEKRYREILESYRALFDLKKAGKADAIGVGAKDWRSIQRLSADINFDWVMIANSMTIHSHPDELVQFMKSLADEGVHVINSAVFNGGFLTGGDFYNYKKVTGDTAWGNNLLKWRESFFAICKRFDIEPAQAALAFGRQAPGVGSVCVSSSDATRLQQTMQMANTVLPDDFWEEMRRNKLL